MFIPSLFPIKVQKQEEIKKKSEAINMIEHSFKGYGNYP